MASPLRYCFQRGSAASAASSAAYTATTAATSTLSSLASIGSVASFGSANVASFSKAPATTSHSYSSRHSQWTNANTTPLNIRSSQRWQSTATDNAASPSGTSGTCPITGRSSTSTNSTPHENHETNLNLHPTLTQVPTLPFFGSLLRTHSQIPPLDKPYDFWPSMRAKYGDFYSFGLPGLGDPDSNDSNSLLPSLFGKFGSFFSTHTAYVIQSPKEMAKVIRSEGAYPSGMAQSTWAIFKWEKEAGFEIVSHPDGGFAGQGADWKRLRTFMQTDLLHPEAARGYRSIIIEAAELASRGAQASAADGDGEGGGVGSFLERCAFDMFSAVMFGDLMNSADSTTPTAAEDEEFVANAKEGLGRGVQLSRSMKDMILVKQFGIETEGYKQMKKSLDVAWKIGGDKIERFMEKRSKGELNEREKNSYLFRALERFDSGGSNVSLKEAKEMSWGGIFAAVDTTSGKMGWNILHAALNPDVQEKLYQELSEATKESHGKLTVDALDKANSPYLHQFIRESHRLTPVVPIATRKRVAASSSKSNDQDGLEIHGVKLPVGSAVVCDAISLMHDPTLVEDPKEFRPERWSEESVKERKGTDKELMDHPFFKDPFSQGARKCPGSRVALNEVAVLLAQLVKDYKISAPEGMRLEDVKYGQNTVVEPILPRLSFEKRV